MSKLNQNMGWGERLAVAAHFGLDDKTITATMGVTQDELSTARELQSAGTIIMATDVDFSQFEEELSVTNPTQKATSTSTKKAETETPAPVTATKPEKVSKKRGRKGDKIKNAFSVIPTTPTNAEEFIATHGISMAVLRQSKRFDKSGTEGVVHVRKDKASGQLMVWRSEPAE